MAMSKEDLALCYKSGEELFRYGKEIMDLRPSVLLYALCSAVARTLVLYSSPGNLEQCNKLKDAVFTAFNLEITRIATEELFNKLRDELEK